jgi:hypothetical protein
MTIRRQMLAGVRQVIAFNGDFAFDLNDQCAM